MVDPTSHLTPSAAAPNRAHKRVQWRKPKKAKKRRPHVLDVTRDALVRGIELRQGSMWHRICNAVAVAGYSLQKSANRVRALRSDGAESLLAMTVALLYLADIRSGFVGKPRPTDGPWQRYTLRDLAQLAYGSQTDADLRRARRSLDMMVSLGWAAATKQARRYVGDGEFRSDPGVRRISFDRICELAGTQGLLSHCRRFIDQTRGSKINSGATQGTAGQGKARENGHGAAGSLGDAIAKAFAAPDSCSAPPGDTGPPPATPPPPRPASQAFALQQIGNIIKILDEG